MAHDPQTCTACTAHPDAFRAGYADVREGVNAEAAEPAHNDETSSQWWLAFWHGRHTARECG